MTGASGMVGFGLNRYFSGRGHVVVPAYNGNEIPEGVKLDITDDGQVGKAMREIKPDWVLHCAAMTDVDGCERDLKMAMAINADAAGTVAGAAGECGAKMVFVSTSFVFGDSKEALLEDAPAKPVNNYGKSKLMGERKVAKSGAEHMIVRIDQPYGWVERRQKQDMVTGTLRKLEVGKPFKVVADWFNCPTYMGNFYDALYALVEKGALGTYNCTGKERLSRFEWAKKIAEAWGLDGGLIETVKSEELKLPAKRPDVLLDTGKVEKETGIGMIGVSEGMKRMKESGIA